MAIAPIKIPNPFYGVIERTQDGYYAVNQNNHNAVVFRFDPKEAYAYDTIKGLSLVEFYATVDMKRAVYNQAIDKVVLETVENVSVSFNVIYNFSCVKNKGLPNEETVTIGELYTQNFSTSNCPINLYAAKDNVFDLEKYNDPDYSDFSFSVSYWIQCPSTTGILKETEVDMKDNDGNYIVGTYIYEIRNYQLQVRQWNNYDSGLRTYENSIIDVIDVKPSYPYPAALWYDDEGSVTALLPEEITTPTLPYPTGLWREEDNKVSLGFNPEVIIGAFANAKNLKQISIPKSVKKIGRFAFRNTKLTKVTIANDCTYCDTSFPEGCIVNFYPIT